jgi:hypothetical protein
MVALVNDESIRRDRFGVDFVRVEQVNEFGLGAGGLFGRNKPDLVCCRSRSNLKNS